MICEKHDIGLYTRLLRFTCVGCGRTYDHDVAAGYLERHYDLDRWRRLNRQMVVWTKRRRQGVTLDPPVQGLETLEEIE